MTDRPALDRRPRRRARWVPNQHGAWAMLAGPLLVGVLASQWRWVHVPLTGVWLVGYLAFFAAGLWLKSGRKARYRPPVVAYSAACLPLGATVLVIRPDLARWAPLFVPLLALGLWLSSRRRDRALASGLATTVAASLMTVVAYDAGGGTDWARAWYLTATMAAYYIGTVLYVKTMIRERGQRRFLVASIGWHAAAAVCLGLVSWPVGGVFALLTARAALAPRLALSPRQVGLGEIGLNALVVLVALLAT